MDLSRHSVFYAALVLSLALVVSLLTSTLVASAAYKARGQQNLNAARELNVKGSARKRVRADLGVWTLAVRAESADLQVAFRDLERSWVMVQDFLGSSGFTENEFGPGAIETSTYYKRTPSGDTTREIVGYSLRRPLTVKSARVEDILTAASAVTELIQKGTLVESAAPEFLVSSLPDLRVSIVGDATRDARARADEIARNAGCTIAAVRDARVGPVQVTRPDSTEVSDYGQYDTGTIEKDVSLVVTITFAIEPV